MPSITLHGYLPNGVAITIDIEQHLDSVPSNYQIALETSNQWLAAGMLIAPPSNEGEKIETIGYAVRMEKVSARDGDIAHYIDLYYDHPDVKHKLLSIYLNTAEQIETFENATGLQVNAMPLWEGNHIERGVSPKQDKYIVRVPKLPCVAWKPNPKYNPEEPDMKKRKPLRLFVRWLEASAAGFVDASAMPSESRQDASNSNAAPEPATIPPIDTEWTRSGQTILKFLAQAQAKLGLNHGQVIAALGYISADPISNVEHFIGTKDEAWAACIAAKCNYNPDEVRVYLGDNVAMAGYVVNLIEMHEVPF